VRSSPSAAGGAWYDRTMKPAAGGEVRVYRWSAADSVVLYVHDWPATPTLTDDEASQLGSWLRQASNP